MTSAGVFVRQRSDPGHEAKLEGTGLERGEDIAEMIMRGRAVYMRSIACRYNVSAATISRVV
jgi:hypothetical protein